MAVDYQKDSIEEKKLLTDKNILESEEYLGANGNLVVPIGKAETGELIVRDLSDIPHILVSGFTGAGKSTFVRTILSVIISEHSSKDVNILIYDTKHIDYMLFDSVPHMISPIVSETEKAVAILRWLVSEIKERLDLLVNNGCKDYKKYNEIQEDSANKMTDIIVVLDDIVSLQLTKDGKNDFLNILRNGRIVGIHAIVVSSMASTKSFQKELISIIPCKVCFKLSTKTESKAILERWGAESLIVPGEIIYKYQNDYYKCQSVYASYENIEKKMKHVACDSVSVKGFWRELRNLFSHIEVNNNISYYHYYDELISLAAEIIINEHKASIGLLQRGLKIGFNRSARIMDQLAERGVVGPEIGTKPREVLMTVDDWNDSCELEGLNKIKKIKKAEHVSTSEINRNNNDDIITKKVFDNALTNNTLSVKEKAKQNEPEIKLRDFAEFSVGDIKLSIHDNVISYTTPIMTKMGKGHIDPEFPGNKVKGLIYKKPSLIMPGYLTFEFDSSTTINNNNPELLDVDISNLSDVVKIKFRTNQDRIIRLFMQQLSEDIGVPIKRI